MLEQEDKTPKGIKKYFLVNENSYIIGSGTFWVVFPLVCIFSFFLGTIKYDSEKINLANKNQALEDSIMIYKNKIKFMIRNSDSAHNILGHMPYSEMKLDTQEFRKVQTNIENAGAALGLIK